MAVRTGQAVVVHDMHSDLERGGWKERMQAQGFQGAIYLPLRHQETSLGVLCLYVSQLLQVSAGCWAKTKESTDSSPVALPLATAKFIQQKRCDRHSNLHGEPMRRIWIDLIETFRKSTVLLHEFELSGETKLPFVCHACHQLGFVSGESPQVLGVWFSP